MRYENLPTEQANPRSRGLDRRTALEIVTLMCDEERGVADAVAAVLPDVAKVVDLAAEALAADGRIFYAGAGSSGRLGVLDAAECPPTFGTSPDRVIALIAGGPEAVFSAREGAEDDRAAGEEALSIHRPGAIDLVVGITSSGATPWVLGVLGAARRAGAVTALVTAGEMEDDVADVAIRLRTGPEVIAGSTRLKAGTATKIVLNMISTGAMVRVGKVYDNLMVDLRAGSKKLRARALGLVGTLCGLGESDARHALERAGGDVKRAVVMARLSVERAEAEKRLDAHGGRLRAALGEEPR